MDKYRFDDVYEKVYEYNDDAQAYIHCGSYLAYNITAKMSESEKIQAVKEGS